MRPVRHPRALRAALATEAFYSGALGSRRSQERRREKLQEAGVIGAVSPAETAISRSSPRSWRARPGREGGPPQNAAGRIHAGLD